MKLINDNSVNVLNNEINGISGYSIDVGIPIAGAKRNKENHNAHTYVFLFFHFFYFLYCDGATNAS